MLVFVVLFGVVFAELQLSSLLSDLPGDSSNLNVPRSVPGYPKGKFVLIFRAFWSTVPMTHFREAEELDYNSFFVSEIGLAGKLAWYETEAVPFAEYPPNQSINKVALRSETVGEMLTEFETGSRMAVTKMDLRE
jgi:hypothetical protein